MQIEQKIESLIAPSLTDMGFAIVRIQMQGGKTLQIMAERLDGQPITLNDCSSISRRVSAILDVEDPISSAYDLEVSSPGTERPLVKREDFEKFSGRQIKLTSAIPVEGRKRFLGQLLGIDGSIVRLITDDRPEDAYKIEFNNISSANLVYDPNALKGKKKKN